MSLVNAKIEARRLLPLGTRIDDLPYNHCSIPVEAVRRFRHCGSPDVLHHRRISRNLGDLHRLRRNLAECCVSIPVTEGPFVGTALVILFECVRLAVMDDCGNWRVQHIGVRCLRFG